MEETLSNVLVILESLNMKKQQKLCSGSDEYVEPPNVFIDNWNGKRGRNSNNQSNHNRS